jgi:catechol 2,3-dioxygenase-like lactoylglutathione lyase family enzyme/DNA-binding CsgD family transcriptional regulator
MMPQRDEPGRPRFTPREKKILRLLATGSTSQEVAFQLGMPLSTTKRGITRIYSKLEAGASSRFARSFRHAAGKTSQRKETNVSLQVTAIMLGVEDVARSKAFYEALGCAIDQDHPTFVSFSLGEGSSSLALYPRDAAAQDAGVSPEGSGFQGVSFHYIVGSNDEVDEVIGKASNAGGKVVKEASGTQWGYFGYFSDPDGHLWKVATSS